MLRTLMEDSRALFEAIQKKCIALTGGLSGQVKTRVEKEAGKWFCLSGRC